MSTGKKIEYDMEALKEKAGLLGIKFQSNISGPKLKEKIDLHMKEIEDTNSVDESSVGVKSVGPSNAIREAELKARKGVMVIITDNDPLDVDNPTIIKGVQNAYFKVGPVIIKKDEEQLVPACIVEALSVQSMVKWVPSINNMTRKPTGNKIAEHRNRYNIQYL